jgi:hypothetical protein
MMTHVVLFHDSEVVPFSILTSNLKLMKAGKTQLTVGEV